MIIMIKHFYPDESGLPLYVTTFTVSYSLSTSIVQTPNEGITFAKSVFVPYFRVSVSRRNDAKEH